SDTWPLEVGNGLSGVRNGAEEAVKPGDDNHGTAASGFGQEPAACRTRAQRLTTRNARVLEDVLQVEPFHFAIGSHPLTLGLEAKAAVRLFFAADADVTKCGTHAYSSLRWAVRIRRCLDSARESRRKSGADPPVASGHSATCANGSLGAGNLARLRPAGLGTAQRGRRGAARTGVRPAHAIFLTHGYCRLCWPALAETNSLGRRT